MEEKIIKFTAAMLVGLTIVFSILYVKLPDVKVWAIARSEAAAVGEGQQNKNTLVLKDMELADVHSHMQLRVALPEGITGEDVQIHNNYLTQTLRIEMPHTDGSYFENYPITGSSDHIEGVSYAQGNDEDVIAIMLDQVYELGVGYDADYYYLDFIEPSALYEKVIVVDAGHGGRDSGAERTEYQ